MLTTINHKHENGYGIRTSKKQCNTIADNITDLFNYRVMFYGSYEYDATSKSYVRVFASNELHAFDTQTDAYWFLANLFSELSDAESIA